MHVWEFVKQSTTVTTTRTSKTIGLNEQNYVSARALQFWYISFPPSARKTTLNDSFKAFWRTGTLDGEFSFFLLNLSATSTNSVPGKFGHIRQVKRVGIIAKWNKRTENHNFNDVFICVAVWHDEPTNQHQHLQNYMYAIPLGQFELGSRHGRSKRNFHTEVELRAILVLGVAG